MIKVYSTQSSYATQSRLKKAAIITIMAVMFSFLGWVCETLMFAYLHREFLDRGLLTLPFCPLYGFGSLAVYAVLRTPLDGVWARMCRAPRSAVGKVFASVGSLVLYLLAAALLATSVEFVTGIFFDKVLHTTLWNYSRYPDNIFNYACLRYSLLWGIMATGSMALIWYPMSRALGKCRDGIIITAAAVLLTAVAVDFTVNMIFLMNTGSRFTLSAVLPKPSRAYALRYL